MSDSTGSVPNRRKQYLRTFRLGELLEAEAFQRVRDAFRRLFDQDVVICDDTGATIDPETGNASGQCADHPGYSVPVTLGRRQLGTILLTGGEPAAAARAFAELMAEMLATLSSQEISIRRRVSELTAVYDLGGLFAHSEQFDDLLNTAARRICDVMRVKAAAIRLLEDETGELIVGGSCNLSDRYLAKGRVTLRDNPIDKATIDGAVVYIEDARTDPRVRFPDEARTEGLVSGLSCPMRYRGHTVGVLRIYSGRKHVFAKFDIELLQAIASQAAAAIVHTRLFAESLAAANYDRQLKYAGQIQRRMIPSGPPAHSRLSFGQVYEPSLEVGGDFFDYLQLPDGNVGIAIADVVGKGLPGALMMASVRSALRAHARSFYDIDQIIAQVNVHMCRDTLVSEFATMLYGVIDPEGTRLTYCNAGHNPGLLLRKDEFIELPVGGPLIGILPDAEYERAVVDLRPGDVLTFFTDGVTEAMDYREHLYGLDRLKESIRRYRGEAAHTLANQLLWDVRRFAGLATQTDDISIVVAKVAC